MNVTPVIQRLTFALVAGAVAVSLFSGCASTGSNAAFKTTEPERSASGFLGIEVCFSNTLAERVDLVTTYNGSGSQWETSLPAGQSACTQTVGSARVLTGTMTGVFEPQSFTYLFENPGLGYPNASVIRGVRSASQIDGPGVCKGFYALESGVYDTGITRFTVKRFEDAQERKQFTVTIGLSKGERVPDTDCLYEVASQ